MNVDRSSSSMGLSSSRDPHVHPMIPLDLRGGVEVGGESMLSGFNYNNKFTNNRTTVTFNRLSFFASASLSTTRKK